MDWRALADLLERVDRTLAVRCGYPITDPLRMDVADARTQLHTLAQQLETAWREGWRGTPTGIR